jgi:hypothetical protein
MITIKDSSVRLTDLCPQMVLAFIIVDGVLGSYGVPCVITSVNDGKHSVNSWHYKGRAGDVRSKYPQLDGKEQEARDKIKAALGRDFDVVIEAIGTDNEHFHVEYDPK